MYQITVKNRWAYLSPVPCVSDVKVLREHLSYIRKGSRFLPNPAWAVVRLYDEKLNRFPIGLLSRVTELIDVECIIRKIEIFDINFGNLRPYQEEALKCIMKNDLGIVKIPTGGGKTKLAVQFLKNFGKSTLILVPTLDLVAQWKAQVPSFVHVKTYASIKKKVYVQQFECVIFDECHHVAAKTLYKIGMSVREGARLYGLSATPLDRDDDNLKVEAVLGEIIYEISARELIDQGFLCDAKVFYHKVSFKDYDYSTYADVYYDYVVINEERNKIIYEVVDNCLKPCLVLVSRIEHGQSLFNIFKHKGVDVVFLNGQLKKDERVNNVHDVIVATGIYDEGIDLPNLRTLVLAAGGKSAIKATQRIGRLLRPSIGKDYAIIHDFADDCRWLRRHYNARRHIFERDFRVYDV